MECIYCHEESEFRRSIMEELCTLPYSTVYVFRSQTYYGRCVVAFRLRHVNELFELTAEGGFAHVAHLRELNDRGRTRRVSVEIAERREKAACFSAFQIRESQKVRKQLHH